ncbi:MAG: hypothetical protein GX920_04625 [Micrococcus sp.]|nr:hypothetical protein [Micrococcus sp.]
MTSDVYSLPNTFDILAAIQTQGSDTAMVTWVGYDSPSALTVAHQHHADHGAKQLAPFLEGIEAQRTATNQLGRFVMLAHSCGTNPRNLDDVT